MSAVAGAIVVAGVGGAMIAANASSNAADKQSAAANNASQLQYNEFQQQQANQRPWIDAGQQALGNMQVMSHDAPSFTQQDFLNNQDPGYAFNLQQGQDAIQRSAAARGGLQNGGTLKSLSDYSQGMASNEYQNAYGRFMNNQNTQFNRLASIAGTGQTANGQLGQAGQNMANQVGNNMMGSANAQAAAGIAGGQAWGNTLSSLGTGAGNYMMQQQMLNRFAPQQPGYGSAGGGAVGYGSAMGQASAPINVNPGFGSSSGFQTSPYTTEAGL